MVNGSRAVSLLPYGRPRTVRSILAAVSQEYKPCDNGSSMAVVSQVQYEQLVLSIMTLNRNK